jgi:hypothetical protein
VRASKKLRNDELLITTLGPTILRKHLDEVPLWRGDHVAVRQLVEDFAQYLYLDRLSGPEVLIQAVSAGVALLTWEADTFAYADSYDENAGRYRGLQVGQMVNVTADSTGLLVKPEVARRQLDAELSPTTGSGTVIHQGAQGLEVDIVTSTDGPDSATLKRRFHGTVALDPQRVGLDASRIAQEVIAHLSGLVGADVNVTLEIEAQIPSGAPDDVVRIVSENSRTLGFTTHGFESE